MARKAPGRAHRKGLTFLEVADMFRDEDTARDWITSRRWPDGPHCPRCGSVNVQSGIKHKTMTHRCRECTTGKGKNKTMFSIKTGTVMEGSNLKYRAWAVGIYLFTTNIKGVSSMRLHRELRISQKAAWFMLHRLRMAFEAETGPFAGPVEVDETYMGGKRRNMSNAKRKELAGTGRGAVGKMAIVGAKDRDSNAIRAEVVDFVDGETLQEFVREHARPGATLYTDEAKAYKGMPEFDHEAVNHSVSEFVRDQAHTNGMESFWSLLKLGQHGIYHKMSPKHLERYVHEFAGRQNARDADTVDQITGMVAGMAGKRLRYSDLMADNGFASGARS